MESTPESSWQSSAQRKTLFRVLIFAGLVIPLVTFVVSGPSLAVAALYLAFPILAVGTFGRRFLTSAPPDSGFRSGEASQRTRRLVQVLFFVFIDLAVIVMFLTQDKPFVFYFLMSVAMGSVVWQILWCGSQRSSRVGIFVEITIISQLLMWSKYILHPFFVESLDVLWHRYFEYQIQQSGYVSPDYMAGYAFYPAQHVMVVVTSDATGLGITDASHLVFGLIALCLSIFMYTICVRILRDFRLGLLAVLFYALARNLLYYVPYEVPWTFALVPSFIVIMVVLRLRRSVAATVVTLVAFAALLISHPVAVAAAFLLMFLSFALFGRTAVSRQKASIRVANSNLLVMIVLISWLSYAIYVSGLFGFVIQRFLLFNLDQQPRSTYAALSSGSAYLAGNLDLSFTSFLSLLGICSFILRSTPIKWVRNPRTYLAALAVLLYYPNVAQTSALGSSLFLLDRWAVFVEPIIVVFVVIGVSTTLPLLRGSHRRRTLIVVLVLVTLALSSSNQIAASDSPLVKNLQTYQTPYFTQEEVAASQFIRAVVHGQPVRTDYRYAFLFIGDGLDTTWIQADNGHINFSQFGLYVLRTREIRLYGIQVSSAGSDFVPSVWQPIPITRVSFPASQLLSSESLVFNSGDVALIWNPS